MAAFEEANVDPSDIDVLEVHDAFAIEELLYAEALGLCKPGEAASRVESGDSTLVVAALSVLRGASGYGTSDWPHWCRSDR